MKFHYCWKTKIFLKWGNLKWELNSVKTWPDLPCRWLKKNILRCLRTVSSQHLLFPSSRREQLTPTSKRTLTRHWLGSPSCQSFTISAVLWSPPGHHHCWLCHSSQPPCTQPTAWASLSQSTTLLTGWLGKQNRAGWCCYALKFWFQGDLCSFPPWFAGMGDKARSSFCAWSQTRN